MDKKIFPYQKILVVGPGGAGKSTFSKKLSEVLNIPVYHLDRIYWLPNWEHISREEFIEKVHEITSTDKWIIDGNYSGSLEERVPLAEVIIFLDFNIFMCVNSAIKRAFKSRKKQRDDLTEGCIEKIDKNFIDFLNWIWVFRKKNRPKMLAIFDKFDTPIIRFENRKQLYKYLEQIKKGIEAN